MNDTPTPEPTPATNGSTSSTPPPMPDPFAPASSVSPQISPSEIADGKALAILSYAMNFVQVPFWILPLVLRNNAFSLYHAKQCMILWLGGIAFASVFGIVTFIGAILTAGLAACVFIPLGIAVLLAAIVFNIIGLLNAISDKAVPIPLIGVYAETWFAGIRKAPAP